MKKKRWMKRIASAVLTAAMVVSQIGVWNADWGQEVVKAEETNYVQNGDFEGTGVSPWSFDANSDDNISYNIVSGYTGVTNTGHWLEIKNSKTWDNTEGATNSYEVKLTQQIASIPAGTYKLTYSVGNWGTKSIGIVSGNSTEPEWISHSASAWSEFKTYTKTIVVGENEQGFTIGFDFWVNNASEVYFDDISLVKVEESNSNTEAGNVKDSEGNLFTGLSEGLNGWNVAGGTATYQNGRITITTDNENGADVVLCQSIATEKDKQYIATVDAKTNDNNVWVNAYIGKKDNNKSIQASSVISSLEFEVTGSDQAQDIGISVWVPAGASCTIERLELVKKPEEDTSGAIEAGIKIEKVSNLPDDFIKGVDVSSYISEKDSGVKYYDFAGNELNDQGFFNLLKSCGVNYVRIRVWHNPYDANGKGYGGGTNDLEKAKRIGAWATQAGMKVLIDFHYSDFWTDPGKQYTPKAWTDYNVQQKAEAINTYTKDSLNELLNAGVDVGMVQVGNETNAKFCGEKEWSDICTLFQAGCSAVREVEDTKFGESVENGSKIMIALHFADPQKGEYPAYAQNLNTNNVDYDIFASSYYPFFHGSISNLTSTLKYIAETYNKKVMVAETSWATTLDDGDSHDNQIRVGTNDTPHYEFSVLGQATEVRTVMDAVVKVGEAGIGVFYWEPAWIPVQYAYDSNGNLNQSIKNSNVQKWEKYGSGWASSYAGAYQEDAATWYGGSAMDNQAMFDMYGNPLESLKVFNYVKTGTYVKNEDVNISSATVDSIQMTYGESVEAKLPTAKVGFNNATSKENVVVNWNETDIAKAQAGGVGEYTIRGTVSVTVNEKELTQSVKCFVTILPVNYMPNYSLEGTNEWTFSSDIVSIKADGNSKTGNNALKFWSGDAYDYTASIEVTIAKSGVYKFGGYIQGGDVGDDVKFTYSVKVGENTPISVTADELKGHKNWIDTSISKVKIAEDNTTVTITVTGSNIAAGGWGSWDDFYIIEDNASDSTGGSTDNNNSGSTPSTPPTNTKPDNTTETKPDGTKVETTTETKPDGTKVETTTETATDGSKKETVVETKSDGTKVETITETATDGSKVETKKESETNIAGKQVDVATVTKTDADGKVTSVAEKSTINEIAENTTATVTVKKDSEGAVTSATASVAVTIEGKKTSLSADVIAQVQEASGQKDVAVTVTAKNDEGKTLYKVKVDTKDLTADNALYIYKVDSKTGELVMVNSKTYKVDENGGLDISIKNKATYELVSKAEAKAIEKQIKATVKVQNSSKDVKKGKTTKVAFDKKMNMNNVKSITYQTADKKIATVSKSGKVTAKAKGTVTVKATVTLKNGSKKTVTMKIKVK